MENKKTRTMKVYAYTLRTNEGEEYYGTYTIYDSVKPLGYENEFLLMTRKVEC